MRKRIALTALAMVPFSVSHANEAELVGIITAETLNVRSGPGSNFEVLYMVNKDDRVTITDTSNGWHKVKNNEDKEGWISSKYISISESSETVSRSSSYEQKEVNTNGLNMRSGASTSYRVITTLNKGTKVEVISESNGWSKIKYDGRLGYVYSIYLDDIKPSYTNTTTKTVNTNSLNVRSGPSTSNSIVGKLSKGTKVSVISESNGWSKILYNNKECYVSSRYLDSKSSSSDNSNNNSSNSTIKETKEVNTDSLNVRTGPSTSYSKLGTLSKGTKVGVISESNGWSKILYNNKEAYVSSQYLSKISSGSTDDNTSNTVKETKEVNTDSLNVRSGPSTSYSKLGTLSKGTKVGVISESNGWSKILYNDKEAYVSSQYLSEVGSESGDTGSGSTDVDTGAFGQGTVSDLLLSYTFEQHLSKQVSVSESGYNRANGSKATKLQIEEKLNPSKIISASSYGKLQFLRIDRYTDGITASELNKFLNSKVSSSNVFYNKGQQFIDAAKKYDIDVVYFVAHCMWETGYGSSTLAKGQTLTTYKGQALSKPVTVYNFFGIGAYDGTANLSGAETAYKYGWTSIDATIEGSAKWIAANYIKHSSYKQNTVYKMKWNYGSHQYATDINWCNGIASVMNSLIGYYDNQSKLVYERLVYK